jgi:hypothetical protein
MKKICLLLSFSSFTLFLSAQDFTKYNDVELKTNEDCRDYDSVALECASYILSTPVDANANRLSAIQLLFKWMTATPDYSFSLDGKVSKYGSKEDFILAVYMAALTKYALENKQMASDANAVALNAFHTLAVYCNDSNNHVKPDKDLKKLIEADKNGTLKDYLHQ